MKWTLINPSGTNDPDTGDIYSGLDRFGRVKDNRWLDGMGADLDRIQYGYDRAGNRIWRKNVVAASLSKEFDELYDYDAIHRLNDMARGTLNGPKTALTSSTFGQRWTLDATGNWQGFREDDTGDGTWDLVQSRTANPVNEITAISETSGPSWVTPAYSAAGNMTTLPQPDDPTQGYTATYDAWNRLVKLEDGEETVSEYAYDGAKRRTVQKSYVAGVLDQTRHLYYTEPSQWQVIEERVEASTDAERQFVWGLRYIDDLVLRDRDTGSNGTLDERLYACQDANWNVVSLMDSMGAVQERYVYSAYGVPLALSPDFTLQPPAYGWETLYCGYKWELPTGLYYVRNRVYQPKLGAWVQRDSLLDSWNVYAYVNCQPLIAMDPLGLISVGAGQNWPGVPQSPIGPHDPGGPWHPAGTTKCTDADTCAQLLDKIGAVIREHDSHRRWDEENPADPRWPDGRHSQDIAEIENQLRRCFKQYTKRCRPRKCPRPEYEQVPNPQPDLFQIVVIGIIIILVFTPLPGDEIIVGGAAGGGMAF